MSTTSSCLNFCGVSSDSCWLGCGAHFRKLDSEAFPYPFFIVKTAVLTIVESVMSLREKSSSRIDVELSRMFCDGRVEVVFIGCDANNSFEVLKSKILFARGMSLSSVVYNIFTKWHDCNKRVAKNGDIVHGLSPNSYAYLQNLSLPVVRPSSVRQWVDGISSV